MKYKAICPCGADLSNFALGKIDTSYTFLCFRAPRGCGKELEVVKVVGEIVTLKRPKYRY